MVDDAALAEMAPARRPVWQRLLKWLGIAILSLVALVAIVLFGINTDPGRRFVADQIGAYKTATGLNIRVGRIDGSLYGKMVLSDLRVYDPKGVFLTSPRLDVDWRPFQYLHNHVDVRSLAAGLVTLARRPVFLQTPPTDENAPLLPDLDIDVDSLKIGRFVIGAPVTGQQHVLSIDGQAHIADRRAQLLANAQALRAPGIAGGDRLVVRLDAVPDDNKLDVNVKLQAPTGGVVATMGGLKAPLNVSVDGKGSWASWQGRAVATLGGGELADLALSARDGHIEVRGPTRPGLYLEGPVERLTAPQLDVAVDTTLADRRADTRLTLKSDALAVDAGGLIDLAASRFGNFAADIKLLTPGAIAPNLRGRDVTARIVLDGAFATPTVDYKVRGAALGFGEMGLENFYAEGLARVNADRIMVPIKARARRLVGLNAAVGGLANNATIEGDLAIAMPSILSDNLRIRSDNIDATAILAANVQTGRYTGALKGRINNYRVESIGIVNLTTDAKLVTTPNGFGVKGRVVAQTRQIFNDGLRTFLGGNAVVRADVGYDPAGVVNFSGVRMNAPQFRITRGAGRYVLSSGQLLVDADAYSTQYGPITARITGSALAPVVVVRAARPGLGVGLANVQARIVGRNGAYAVTAGGRTNYGPFTADVLVRPGAQLAIDVRRVVFAGIAASGRIVQTAAGPFAGALRFAGQGLTGDVRLAAQGRYQRADVSAQAFNATIPGYADFTIGRAIVSASAVLTPTPQVVVDVQIGNTRYNTVVIDAARAKVNYVGGRGTAQALVTGSSGVPFRLAVNAKLAPNNYLVAAQGQANGVPFRTVNPARVLGVRGGYQLSPTRIDFGGAPNGSGGGSLRLAGRYGQGMAVQARLDRLDLAFANVLMPGLGIAGQATGSLDYAQASGTALPTADARLTIRNFQRTGLAAVSQAVDVVFAGNLGGAGAQARALIRRGPTVIGRMVATVAPGAGTGVARLTNGAVGGGIRYNGPSSVLFSFAALPNQQLNGPIALAADFSGPVRAPRVTGMIRADNLTYDNEVYGTRLTNMRLAGRFTNDRLEITTLDAKAGDGTVKAQGSIGLAAASGFPIDVRAQLANARLAKSDSLGATATGSIHLTNGPGGGLIEGDLTIPEARYEIIRQGAAEVPELTGVRRRSQIRIARSTDRPTPPAPPANFRLAIRVRAENQLFVSGMGLESEWKMDMRVTGTSTAPVITGGLDLVRGTYSFSGKRFEVTRGTVRFRGGALTDPDINIQASTTAGGITAIINVTGTGQRPQISFTSTPNLPQDEVLSRLLFGSAPENLSATEAIQLAAALNSLRGSGGGGLNPLGKLRSATGFDRLRILGADDATGRGTSLAAGKYLTNNIYVEIVTDSKGFTATQLEIALTKALSLLSSTGSFGGGTSASLRYSKDY